MDADHDYQPWSFYSDLREGAISKTQVKRTKWNFGVGGMLSGNALLQEEESPR